MPLYKRSGRRLSWLTLDIVLNIIAASVIAMYQDILAAAIALAVFLPMVSDMSGCSGNQAVAVSLRELSLDIGTALAGNTLVAVTVGGMLPLILKKLRIDPALVSSPLLTTVTDMCGFFLVLSLASMVLPRLSV
jgi:magnesium transporter